MYKPLVQYLPNSNFALGLMVEGLKSVKNRQANAAKPKPKPKAPAASVEAGSSKPKSVNTGKSKALQAAYAKYNRTGSFADYQSYLRLKNKSNS